MSNTITQPYDFEVILDYPPERVAHDATAALDEVLKHFEMTFVERALICKVRKILEKKA